MRRGLAGTAAAVVLMGGMLFPALPARAQEQTEPSDGAAPQRGQFAGMQRAGGEITAVSGANLTVKTPEGATVQVVTTANTRVMKGRGITVKIADLKVGDGVMAMGNLDAPNKTLHAAMVMATDAAQLKAMKDNLGKTYIAGKVTAIDADNAKMTVQRPDGVSQTIGFDETTSFKRGRIGRGMGMSGDTGGGDTTAAAPAATGESITLADIKVGDNVYGTGSVKSGAFVPTQLTVGAPGQGRRRNGAGSPNATPTAPAPAGTPGPGTK